MPVTLRFISFRRAMIARVSAFTLPWPTSTSRQTNSASFMPAQAEATMAFSRRRLGAKMPGVSTKIICVLPRLTMPMTRVRVV
jgi:hypothetical protein